MEIRCIRDVDEETWKEFKELADKNNLKMSLLLKLMVKEMAKKSENSWKFILNSKKNLSDQEAEAMENTLRKSRKEWGFRE
jgi:hypothetical protein